MEKPSEPLDPEELHEPIPHVTGGPHGAVTGNGEGVLSRVPVPEKLELTWQALLIAFVVAAVVSASYPYVVLKLGMGPNISVVSAFLGAVLLMMLAKKTYGRNRLMNNIVQTAGTSAGSTAFMCVVAAAVDLSAENAVASPLMNGIHHIGPLPMFLWLFCAGGIGVLFTVLFRRHFVDDPKMIFADGVAAAETIVVLDSPGPEARDKLYLLGICTLASAVVTSLTDFWEVLEETYFGPMAKSLSVGIQWSLLNFGTGLLIGLNVSLSMLAASLLIWATGPILIEQGIGKEILIGAIQDEYKQESARLLDKEWVDLTKQEQEFVLKHGGRQAEYMQGNYFRVLLAWYMWPATALMIAAAVTAVLLKWRTIVESFTKLRAEAQQGKSEDVSMTTVVVGTVALTALLAVVLNIYFGMSYAQTAISVLCSLPLILVCIRVLGETNNAPISVMMNGLQAVFAAFWPTSIGHNLIAAGVAGSCNSQGGGTIQDYKTGQLVGSTPRILTWVQLAAVPIGAGAVAIMYPLLLEAYNLGSKNLPAPTGIKISNMAILLSRGIEAFPRGALLWTVIATIVGILSVMAIHFLKWEWMPSAAGFGFGLILPGTLNISVAIGGIAGWLWMRYHKPSFDRYAVTMASGFIAGEALLSGLILPIIRALPK